MEEQYDGAKMVQVIMFVMFFQILAKFSNMVRLLSVSLFFAIPQDFKSISIQ